MFECVLSNAMQVQTTSLIKKVQVNKNAAFEQLKIY